MRCSLLPLIATLVTTGWSQTKIDLANEGKNFDFGNAPWTRPAQTGTVLPPTCTPGQLFYNTSTAAGANLFGCTSANVWSQESGGSASAINSVGSSDGSVAPALSAGNLDLTLNQGLVATVTGNSDLSGANRLGLGGDGFISITLPNEGVTGTVLNQLASLSSGQITAIQSPAGAAGGILGIAVAGAGATGNVRIATHGFATCTFDGATTAGDYVQASLTRAGYCSDAGRIRPLTGQVVGYVTSTNGGTGSYSVLLNPDVSGTAGASITARSELHLPLAICSNGSVASLAWSTPPAPAVAALPVGCSGTNVSDAYAAFNNSNTPSLQYVFDLPTTLNGPADVYLTYSSSTVSGTSTVALDVVCTATNGTALNDPAWTPNDFFAPGSITAAQISNQLVTASMTGLTWPTGCTAGSRAHFRLIRTDTTGTATSVNIAEVVVAVRRTL